MSRRANVLVGYRRPKTQGRARARRGPSAPPAPGGRARPRGRAAGAAVRQRRSASPACGRRVGRRGRCRNPRANRRRRSCGSPAARGRGRWPRGRRRHGCRTATDRVSGTRPHRPGAQPGEVLTLHAAHALRVDPNFSTQSCHVSAGGVHREAERSCVALVVGRGQHDGRRALAQLVGNRKRSNSTTSSPSYRARRHQLRPPLLLVPVRVWRLPVPDARSQLTHLGDPTALSLSPPRRPRAAR
jgi:hypothetical protein